MDAASDVGPSGLEHPDVVDYVVEEDDGTISLLISETRPWDGGAAQVDQLLAKVNAYVAFVGDGLTAQYPQAAGRPVRVVVMCFHTPAGEMADALPVVGEGLAGIGIGFDVQVLGRRRLVSARTRPAAAEHLSGRRPRP